MDSLRLLPVRFAADMLVLTVLFTACWLSFFWRAAVGGLRNKVEDFGVVSRFVVDAGCCYRLALIWLFSFSLAYFRSRALEICFCGVGLISVTTVAGFSGLQRLRLKLENAIMTTVTLSSDCRYRLFFRIPSTPRPQCWCTLISDYGCFCFALECPGIVICLPWESWSFAVVQDNQTAFPISSSVILS